MIKYTRFSDCPDRCERKRHTHPHLFVVLANRRRCGDGANQIRQAPLLTEGDQCKLQKRSCAQILQSVEGI